LPQLRRIREARGLSLRALAERARLSYVALYHIEQGDTDPRLGTLRRLARVLGVTVGELIGERKPRIGQQRPGGKRAGGRE
jgi:transcriptional regulator with XRE-family HTH domain